MAITSTIVNVSATITPAPEPSTYQQSGAIISVNGTTLTEDTYQYCESLEAVEDILSSSGNYVELTAMATSFFAQGNTVGLYVLELGVQGSSADAITALGDWDTANPDVFYAYLTPATWDSDAAAALNTLAAGYSSATGEKYFFITTTSGTMSAYAVTTKSIYATVNSPTAVSTDFQAADAFYQWLVNNPTSAAPAPPMNFRFVYGSTPWVLTNNVTTIGDILTDYGNLILTGAEGGISTALLRNATMMDGYQAMFWYAVDWVLIQARLQLANAIINGSNSNPPLYYNQAGINTLLAILTDLGNTGIANGLLLSASFSAVPFSTYTTQNPGAYAAGQYNGFSAVVTPSEGFTQVEFFLDAVQFAS